MAAYHSVRMYYHPWLLQEDLLLSSLVDDLGENWHLISDAFNTSKLASRPFRNHKECRHRYIYLWSDIIYYNYNY